MLVAPGQLMTEEFVMYFSNQFEAAVSHGLEAHKAFVKRHAQNLPARAGRTRHCWGTGETFSVRDGQFVHVYVTRATAYSSVHA